MLGSVMRYALIAMAMLGCEVATAQLRLIPKQKLDSVANPRIVEDARMQFKGGAVVSFDTIDEDAGSWEKTLEWRNGSDRTLVVTRVTTSCSCLQAVADKGAVRGGGSSKLLLRYFPKGHPGRVEQRVFVYTNLSSSIPSAIITLRGDVIPSDDRSADYPRRHGALLLRRDTVTFAGDREQVERIACLNVGERELRLEADELSSRGLTLKTEPAVLKAGEEGDLVITYSPVDANKPLWLKLYIKGLALPLRGREITVQIEKKNNN